MPPPCPSRPRLAGLAVVPRIAFPESWPSKCPRMRRPGPPAGRRRWPRSWPPRGPWTVACLPDGGPRGVGPRPPAWPIARPAGEDRRGRRRAAGKSRRDRSGCGVKWGSGTGWKDGSASMTARSARPLLVVRSPSAPRAPIAAVAAEPIGRSGAVRGVGTGRGRADTAPGPDVPAGGAAAGSGPRPGRAIRTRARVRSGPLRAAAGVPADSGRDRPVARLVGRHPASTRSPPSPRTPGLRLATRPSGVSPARAANIGHLRGPSSSPTAGVRPPKARNRRAAGAVRPGRRLCTEAAGRRVSADGPAPARGLRRGRRLRRTNPAPAAHARVATARLLHWPGGAPGPPGYGARRGPPEPLRAPAAPRVRPASARGRWCRRRHPPRRGGPCRRPGLRPGRRRARARDRRRRATPGRRPGSRRVRSRDRDRVAAVGPPFPPLAT